MGTTDRPVAGRVVNDSRSTNAPGVRMSSLRFIRCHPAARFLGQVCLFNLLVLLPLGFVGAWLSDASGSRPLEILGGILLVVGNLGLIALIAAGLYLGRICRGMATIFREALLAPGVVVREAPPEYAVLTNMSTGLGPDRDAVRRFRAARLPGHEARVGTRLPCVAFFQPGPEVGVWGSFDAVPLAFATGKRAILDARLRRIGPDRFERLDRAVADGRVPDDPGEVRFLDEPPA